jgi:Na+-driven multidrug efflux pump
MVGTNVVFGIPFNYIMTFVVGMGINGMLLSQVVTISLFFIVTSITVRRIDYKFECERAAKRIKEDLEIMKKEETEEKERESAR